MLFGVETEDAAPYVALGAFISGVITTIVYGVVKIMNAQHTNSTEVRVWSVKQAQEVISGLNAKNDKLETRVQLLEEANERTERQHNKCLRDNAVMSNWIRWAQPEIEKAGIRVPAFNPDDSSTHQHLTQGGRQ